MLTINTIKYNIKGVHWIAHADNKFLFFYKNEQKQSDIGFQLIHSDQPWEEMSNLGRKGRERNQRQNQIKSSQWESERNISTVFAELLSCFQMMQIVKRHPQDQQQISG